MNRHILIENTKENKEDEWTENTEAERVTECIMYIIMYINANVFSKKKKEEYNLVKSVNRAYRDEDNILYQIFSDLSHATILFEQRAKPELKIKD